MALPDEVTMTLAIGDFAFTHASRTYRVPKTAG